MKEGASSADIKSSNEEEIDRCNDCGASTFLTGKITDPDGGYICGACATARLFAGGKTVH